MIRSTNIICCHLISTVKSLIWHSVLATKMGQAPTESNTCMKAFSVTLAYCKRSKTGGVEGLGMRLPTHVHAHTHYTTHIAGQSPHKVFYKYTLILILDYWKQLHGDSEVESKVISSETLHDPTANQAEASHNKPMLQQRSQSIVLLRVASSACNHHADRSYATTMLIDRMQPPC